MKEHIFELQRKIGRYGRCLRIDIRELKQITTTTATRTPSKKGLMSKTIAVYVRYIEDITRGGEDMNFIFEWQNNILRTSAASE